MNVAVLLFHDVHELAAAGPYSALQAARRHLPDPDGLQVFTVAKSRNSVETSGGLVVTPQWAFASAPEPGVLIVPGGRGIDAASRDRALRSYVLERTDELLILASVGSGAVLLGELGLLRDLSVTTHPGARDRLFDYEPGELTEARVVKNDNGLWFSGGVTAGIELGLELARELCGDAVAGLAARELDYPYWQRKTSPPAAS